MSGSLAICKPSESIKEVVRGFRFSNSPNTNAIILKIDQERMEFVIEETLKDCTVEDIRNELPAQHPRFIIISYQKQRDGRISYPLCLLFYSPPGSSPEMRIIYAGSRNNLINECDLTKSAEIQDIDEISEALLDSI